jgi:heptosyltransferase II
MGTSPKVNDINSPPSRILAIQTAFIGDIVLTTSFLANLRRLAPNAEICFLTTPVGARVLEGNRLNVQCIPYDKRGADAGVGGFLKIVKKLRGYGPELVFCLHRSLRSSLIAKASGGKVYAFHDGVGACFLHHQVRRPERVFEAEKNHAMLLAWAGEGARNLPLYPVLSLGEAEKDEAEKLLAGFGPFVALAPSSVWATKRWPAERFAKLAEMLWEKRGLRAVIVGGNEKADLEVGACIEDYFRQKGSNAARPLNLIGKTGLGGLKAVLCRATLLVANDTAPLHIGIALGVPVVGVFGPTTRELGFFPLAPKGKSGVAEHAALECRPCGLHGHQVSIFAVCSS